MGPADAVLLRVGFYVALEVNVVPLFDFVRIQRGAQR